jgi:hypothetical protein
VTLEGAMAKLNLNKLVAACEQRQQEARIAYLEELRTKYATTPIYRIDLVSQGGSVYLRDVAYRYVDALHHLLKVEMFHYIEEGEKPAFRERVAAVANVSLEIGEEVRILRIRGDSYRIKYMTADEFVSVFEKEGEKRKGS